MSLRNAFKNFRKGCPKEKKDAPSLEPPPKRVKVYTGHEEDIEDDEYEEALKRLKEYGKHQKGSDQKNVKHLMELTKLRCHAWIRKDRPLILEVIEKFPCLGTSKWVRLLIKYYTISSCRKFLAKLF